MKKLVLALVLVLLAGRSWGDASSDSAAFLSQMNDEGVKVSSWFSDQVANRIGFLTHGHLGEPPASLGIAHFEVAALAGFSEVRIDTSALNSLNLQRFAPAALSSQVPAMVTVPYGRLRAHVGLPGFFLLHSPDLGLTAGGTSFSYGDSMVNITDFGGELRTNVIEGGLLMPINVSLALTYDYLQGTLNAGTSFSQKSTDPGTGTSYDLELNRLAYQTSFTNSSIGLRAVASKNLILLTPYAGAAAEEQTGSVQTNTLADGTLSASNPGPPASSATTPIHAGYAAAAAVPTMHYRALGGLDVHVGLFDVDAGVEYDLGDSTWMGHLGGTIGL
jgi:hypothetical protein